MVGGPCVSFVTSIIGKLSQPNTRESADLLSSLADMRSSHIDDRAEQLSLLSLQIIRVSATIALYTTTNIGSARVVLQSWAPRWCVTAVWHLLQADKGLHSPILLFPSLLRSLRTKLWHMVRKYQSTAYQDSEALRRFEF